MSGNGKRISRRRFLGTAAAATAGAAGLWRGFILADGAKGASEKLTVGVIGVAGQGEYDWTNIAGAGAEIVALCDVDERRTGTIRERYPDAKFYPDFRQLLDQKGIDAVQVSTPDHTHAVATLMALRSGRHVYCEKPLAHTVQEARLVAETAAKEKRVTQMGTQIHAGSNYRRVVELIQGGTIGKVQEVHVMCGKNWGGGERPQATVPVPEGLHYDLWIGPAPFRPYHPVYLPENWRRWWDFGGGTLADMACHHMDLPFWALKLRHPTKISAEGPPVHAETAAIWLIVNYEFPAREDLPPVRFTWYDGGKRPEIFAKEKLPHWGDGSLFVGEKGMLLADYDNWKLLPEEKFKDFKAPAPSIPDSIGHHREWVEACKKSDGVKTDATTCHFGYSGALTEAVLLGNAAYRLGKPIDWDAAELKAKGEPGADRFIRKEYRSPWTI